MLVEWVLEKLYLIFRSFIAQNLFGIEPLIFCFHPAGVPSVYAFCSLSAVSRKSFSDRLCFFFQREDNRIKNEFTFVFLLVSFFTRRLVCLLFLLFPTTWRETKSVESSDLRMRRTKWINGYRGRNICKNNQKVFSRRPRVDHKREVEIMKFPGSKKIF